MKKFKVTVFVPIVLMLLCVALAGTFGVLAGGGNEQDVACLADTVTGGEVYRCYLSDIEPIEKSIGYGTMQTDTNMSGAKISYIVDGERTYFMKGVTAHATSTLVYDIGESHKYDYFRAYLGVDAVQAGKGEVKFYMYTSADKNTWSAVVDGVVKTSADESIYVNTSVKGVRYLKFVFDRNGVDWNDHSGMGNPLLYSAGALDGIDTSAVTLEHIDETLQDVEYDDILLSYRKTVLQRMLIEAVGQGTLKELLLGGGEITDMLTWLWNDEEALCDFITGGEPDGNYLDALCILSDLYKANSADLGDEEALFEPEQNSERNRGDVYRTMMMAIALTHADGGPHMWLDGNVTSDPLERYAAYKVLYLDEVNHLRNDVFENLNVEEMRLVMGGRGHNDELYWLNYYIRVKTPDGTYPGIYSPHRFLRYGKDWNYSEKGYLTESNFAQYDEKYNLSANGLNFSTHPHLWMVFEGSHICWGISYTGTNFANAFGVPSHYNRQPGHAAFFVYNKDSQNRTTWSIDNNISGWTQTWYHEDTVGYGHDRMPCNWGSAGWSSYYNASYLALSSAALDNFENYVDAELLMGLNSLAVAQGNQEKLYRAAIAEQAYHLDAWEKLCRYYVSNKSDEQIAALAEEVANAMYYFPLPMSDLLSILKNGLTARNTASAITQLAKVNNIEKMYLQKGTNAESDVAAKALLAQPAICVTMANHLLGNASSSVATFSFDGENKNEIVFGSQYTNVSFVYSVDGGTSWSDVQYTGETVLNCKIPDTQIAKINDTNDILIWLIGWASEDGNPCASDAYRIDILPGTAVGNLEQNDNENVFLGTFTNIEYSIDGGTTWSDLEASSLFEGDIAVKIRRKPFGTTLQGIESTYEFKSDNITDRKYIKKSRLSIASFSTEEVSTGDNAYHAIDGLLSTRWHTLWHSVDSERYVTIKVDTPIYLSGLDYTPTGANGTASAFDIYVSSDGVNFFKVCSKTGLPTNNVKKVATFSPIYCQYVKFVGVNTVGGFGSARLIELFEDATYAGKEVVGIEIASKPTKLSYYVNQKINLDGLAVNLKFADSSVAMLPTVDLDISEVDMTTAGTKTVTIAYGTYASVSFDVEVVLLEDCTAMVGVVGYDTLAEAISQAETGEEIILMKSILLDSGIQISKKVVLNGNNNSIKRSSSLKGSPMFNVGNGGEFIISDLTIDGGADWSGEEHKELHRGVVASGFSSTATMLYLTGNGKFTMTNSVLKNNYNLAGATAGTGGAIFANGTASIVINSGEIRDCYSEVFGSAIYFRDDTSLVINGGTFRGNSGSQRYNTSALCVDNNAVCTVNGGTFKYNYGYASGGVFWVSNGALTINGGTFEENIASRGAGIFVNGSAKIKILDFDSMQEVFLTDGRFINLETELYGKVLPIKSNIQNVGTVIAKYTDEGLATRLILALDYADKMLVATNGVISIGDISSAKAILVGSEKETHLSSLEVALALSEDGDSIKLLDDVNLESDLEVDNGVSIDCGTYSFVGMGNLLAADGHDMVVDGATIIFSKHVHEFTLPTYTWSEDGMTCTAERCCGCGLCETEVVAAQITVSQVATCTQVELSTYTVEFLDEGFAVQVKEGVQTAGMRSHAYANCTYTWDIDAGTCTAQAVCECGDQVSEIAQITAILTQSLSCENDEMYKYIAEFASDVFSKQQKENVVTAKKTGHTYGELVYSWNEDYTEYTVSAACSCGDVISKTVGVDGTVNETEENELFAFFTPEYVRQELAKIAPQAEEDNGEKTDVDSQEPIAPSPSNDDNVESEGLETKYIIIIVVSVVAVAILAVVIFVAIKKKRGY